MFQENANKISEKLIAKIINDSMGDPRSRDQYFCISKSPFCDAQNWVKRCEAVKNDILRLLQN